jgi:hypothetical protein
VLGPLPAQAGGRSTDEGALALPALATLIAAFRLAWSGTNLTTLLKYLLTTRISVRSQGG